MEQGNEGDEILFFSCRQIGCDVPEGVKRVGDLTAELLILIIARCLLLISNGAVEVPNSLPSNIAVRHRICTEISGKLKDLGYPAECGYNQLLYPVEHQTRDLLKWTLDRVPRSQQEGGGEEEILGANALLNRNISLALTAWKKSLWRLPCALSSAKPPISVYKVHAFDTEREKAASLLHCHALERVRETHATERINRRFAAANNTNAGITAAAAAAASGVGAEDVSQSLSSSLLGEKIMQSVQRTAVREKERAQAKAKRMRASNNKQGLSADKEDERDAQEGQEEAKSGEYTATETDARLQMSLSELVRSIAAEGESVRERESDSGGERGTRFAHATVFSQEDSLSSALAATVAAAVSSSSSSLSSSSSSAAAVSSASFKANVNAAALSAEHAARLAALSKETMESAQRLAKLDLEERKKAMEEEEVQRQEQLQSVKKEIDELNETVEAGASFEEKIQTALDTLQTTLEDLQKQSDELEKECVIKKKVLEMMPSAADNIAKLQSICDSSTQRLKALEEEWAQVKAPLDNELLTKEKRKAARLNRVATMIEEIKKYRDVMASMVHELKEKQERAQLLQEEKAKLPKNLNRALYTHRIMDISNSIAKQNKEIGKITSDIRDLQKTLNLSTNTLSRSDAVTEELIFAAASDRNDPVMVEIYRKLKQLRSAFEALINTVSLIGNAEKGQRDLETKIEQERSRVSAHNYQRIQQDLQAVVQENQALLTEIKKKTK